jgi:hypothetical protein
MNRELLCNCCWAANVRSTPTGLHDVDGWRSWGPGQRPHDVRAGGAEHREASANQSKPNPCQMQKDLFHSKADSATVLLVLKTTSQQREGRGTHSCGVGQYHRSFHSSTAPQGRMIINLAIQRSLLSVPPWLCQWHVPTQMARDERMRVVYVVRDDVRRGFTMHTGTPSLLHVGMQPSTAGFCIVCHCPAFVAASHGAASRVDSSEITQNCFVSLRRREMNPCCL